MANARDRAKPVLRLDYCKGCGRCIGACAQGCISPGTEVDAASGLVPVALHLDACNGCDLCVDACPEPYGLVTAAMAKALAGSWGTSARTPLQSLTPAVAGIPELRLALPRAHPLART